MATACLFLCLLVFVCLLACLLDCLFSETDNIHSIYINIKKVYFVKLQRIKYTIFWHMKHVAHLFLITLQKLITFAVIEPTDTLTGSQGNFKHDYFVNSSFHLFSYSYSCLKFHDVIKASHSKLGNDNFLNVPSKGNIFSFFHILKPSNRSYLL